MQMLLYIRPDDLNSERLKAAVREALPQQTLQIFQSIPSLKDILCTIIEPESIAIFSAINQTELGLLNKLRPLLSEIFVILIIPNNRKGTIHLAHQLLPRFISPKEDSFSDLKDVLRKMTSTPH